MLALYLTFHNITLKCLRSDWHLSGTLAQTVSLEVNVFSVAQALNLDKDNKRQARNGSERSLSLAVFWSCLVDWTPLKLVWRICSSTPISILTSFSPQRPLGLTQPSADVDPGHESDVISAIPTSVTHWNVTEPSASCWMVWSSHLMSFCRMMHFDSEHRGQTEIYYSRGFSVPLEILFACFAGVS